MLQITKQSDTQNLSAFTRELTGIRPQLDSMRHLLERFTLEEIKSAMREYFEVNGHIRGFWWARGGENLIHARRGRTTAGSGEPRNYDILALNTDDARFLHDCGISTEQRTHDRGR